MSHIRLAHFSSLVGPSGTIRCPPSPAKLLPRKQLQGIWTRSGLDSNLEGNLVLLAGEGSSPASKISPLQSPLGRAATGFTGSGGIHPWAPGRFLHIEQAVSIVGRKFLLIDQVQGALAPWYSSLSGKRDLAGPLSPLIELVIIHKAKFLPNKLVRLKHFTNLPAEESVRLDSPTAYHTYTAPVVSTTRDCESDEAHGGRIWKQKVRPKPSKLPSRDVLVCRRMKLAGDVYFPAG
ncbi:hypothetical protein PGT21_020722 [Puccinia graminis f. sp. tritici]|uniref:Uncharacterized protein n=1 Tax=Puccinia graminis f. sp. tritici TaxID=56615 RepID=A0A5B0LU25_PUCGR|nr:hypothetical protein PGT21_020722 [Puccinia graminis f. sp. tritici]